MEKSCRKYAPKANPRPLLLLVNKPLHAKKLFKIRYFERGLAFKKLTLFFLPNPVPFNAQSYQKQKRPGTNDQSLFRL